MRRFRFILFLLSFVICHLSFAQSRYAWKLPATGYNAILVGQSGAALNDTVQGVYNSTLNMHVFDGDSSGWYKMYVDATGGTTWTEYSQWGGTTGRYIPFNGTGSSSLGPGSVTNSTIADNTIDSSKVNT
ncbi:MAG: hypothetical protein D6706_09620, partial [Chloroflexi bacterium]